MLTERYSGLSFKFFLHFSMRFFTLESLRRTIICQQETTANTTKLVTDLIKSIDPDLNESDIIRSHRIGNTVRVVEHGRALPPRQIIVRLKDSNVKKRILKCRKNLKDKPKYRSVNFFDSSEPL
jgi:hypothetical protein